MNNSGIRIKGWISALRPFALLGLVLGSLFILGVGINLSRANQAANSPEVKIGQLVSGEIGPNQYVTINGYVIYGGLFTQTEGDKLVGVVNPVIDPDTGEMILVLFTQEEVLTKEGEEMITVSGKTAAPNDELSQLIADIGPDLDAAGLTTNASLYIDNVLQPGQIKRAWLQIGGIGAAMVLCAAIYAMPAIVFEPGPLAAGAAEAGAGLGSVRVTGKLFKAARNNPFESTRRKQHFSKADANLIKDTPNGLLVSVHQVVRHRSYGITVGRTESDWLVRLAPYQAVKIEAGKLYTFFQQPAVRVVYKTEGDKEAVLVFSFQNDQDQAAFINLLKELGFAIQWLGYANTI